MRVHSGYKPATRHTLTDFSIFDLDLESKVISILRDICCNLHTLDNMKTLSQKMKEEFALRAKQTDRYRTDYNISNFFFLKLGI